VSTDSHPPTDPLAPPLTAAQAGIWAGQALDPASPAYVIGEYVDLRGDLNESAFLAAVRRAVDEATGVHATFPDAHHQLARPVVCRMPVLDVGSLDDALAWMRAELARPLDLARGPLFGHALLRLGPAHRIWFQRWHHILIDGFGVALVAHRVAQIYNGEPGAEFAPYPPVIAEDRAYHASPAFADDAAFWSEYLLGAPAPAEAGPLTADPVRHRVAAPYRGVRWWGGPSPRPRSPPTAVRWPARPFSAYR
jgi:nonribosomal peptide synthetase MxcG